MMREVIPKVLWIGAAIDSRDVKRVLAAGISVVIDLAIEEPPILFPRDIVYCRFPLLDGEGNSTVILRAAIETAANFVLAEQPTLVACSGGMSRSPSIVAAVVAKVQSISLEAALQYVAATGPCDLCPSLWSDVRTMCEPATPRSHPTLNLLVIRSLEPEKTIAFYESLGMLFQKEQHGGGPLHWAAELGGLAMEVYPAKSAGDVGGTTRLGFVVDDVGLRLETLRSFGVEIASELKRSQWGLRAVVRDPDGRPVELVERQP